MKKNNQGKGGGVTSRQGNYNKVASHFDEILEKQLWLMRNATQESVQQSAANKLIDKILPNLKATELTGKDGEKFERLIVIRSDVSDDGNKTK